MSDQSVNIRRARLEELKGRINPLLQQHWEEVGSFKDEVALAPLWDLYQRAEENGSYTAIVAEEEKEIIGYAGFFVTAHLHHASLICAECDVIFLRKDKRQGGLGYRLIKESEDILRELGVKKILWHVKPLVDFSPLLKGMGYIHENSIYGKIL